MELNPEEKQLLTYLANEWKNAGPPGYLEASVLAEYMHLSLDRTKSIIHNLFVKGLVDTDERDHYAAYLTPEGFEITQS